MQAKTDLVTGEKMLRLKIERALSDSGMCALFSISPGKMKMILDSGQSAVRDPVVCYLYRQYINNPELIDGIDLSEFYEEIGGKDTISGTDFSLIIGRELTAYIRYRNGGNPTQSLQKMLQNAMKVSGGDVHQAFESIKELYLTESSARGVDPIADKTWNKDANQSGEDE